MNSAKTFALISALLLAAFLWLRPKVGELGYPTTPDVHGRTVIRSPESAGLPSSSVPEGARLPSRATEVRPPPTGAISHLGTVEARILEIVNEERKRQHVGPLQFGETLRSIAQNHSDDMLTRVFFDHVNPSGEGPSDRIARQDRRLIGTTGENIWEFTGYDPSNLSGLAEKIMRDWMSSPGHRENILRREFTYLGVGVSAAGAEVRATQDFAHIQALLDQPLPAAAKQGTLVDLSTSGNGRPAERFDIWSTEKGMVVAGPALISGAKLDAPPGIYTLRFYYVRAPGSFTILAGPRIEIQ